MAAAVTPSKITDYFPPSPKPEEKDETKCDGPVTAIEESKSSNDSKPVEESQSQKDSQLQGDCESQLQKKPDEQGDSLVTSSLVLTPKSSPAKEEETNAVETETKVPSSESTCKKSLNEVLKQDAGTPPVSKSKRRGRRKKNKGTKTDTPAVSTTNGPGRPKTARKKTTAGTTEPKGKNALLTDYFPVRRSDRKTKTQIEQEKEADLQYKILNNCVEGLKVVDIANKGRGVIATKEFQRGDFVVEYAGDLISIPEAKERDTKYSKDPTKGCYMYYFNFKGKNYCIDATEESGKLGRLLNHSKSSGNCHTKLIDVNNHPYLILAALRDIKSGEELTYDYGDRSKSALEAHPWLKA